MPLATLLSETLLFHDASLLGIKVALPNIYNQRISKRSLTETIAKILATIMEKGKVKTMVYSHIPNKTTINH